MMVPMTDRVALVTGGSSGIGEQTALRLQGAGFTTYAVARRVDRMTRLAESGVTTFAMDVTDDASMTGGIGRILDEHGRVDVLVNNAGYGSYGAVENVPIDEARRQFEVNVFGLARLVQLVTPRMRAQRSGRIINLSSIGGKYYEPLGAWYHATKFAVEGFSDSLRLELAPYGIRVVIVEPGPIRTEWNTIARDGLVASSARYGVRAAGRGRARTDGVRRGTGVLQRPRRGREGDREGRYGSPSEDALPGRAGSPIDRHRPTPPPRPGARRRHRAPLLLTHVDVGRVLMDPPHTVDRSVRQAASSAGSACSSDTTSTASSSRRIRVRLATTPRAATIAPTRNADWKPSTSAVGRADPLRDGVLGVRRGDRGQCGDAERTTDLL